MPFWFLVWLVQIDLELLIQKRSTGNVQSLETITEYRQRPLTGDGYPGGAEECAGCTP